MPLHLAPARLAFVAVVRVLCAPATALLLMLSVTARADYTTGPVIQNPTNGGTTPVDADFLITGETTAIGSNTIRSLTLDAGGVLTLDANEALAVSDGAFLSRAGGVPSKINGGLLSTGWSVAGFSNEGDLEVSSRLTGLTDFRKAGTGMLTFAGTAAYGGSLFIDAGRLRLGAPSSLPAQALSVQSGAVLDLVGNSTSIGSLNGAGRVELGAATLRIGGLSKDTVFSGVVAGAGGLVIEDAMGGVGVRTFAGANTFSGGVVLNAGTLGLGSNSALGSGTLTINGGQVRASAAAVTISSGVVLARDFRFIGQNSLSFLGSSSLMGVGSVQLRGAGNLAIRTEATYTGETRIGAPLPGEYVTVPGTLTLAGATGAAIGTSAVHVERGGSLLLDDAIAFAGAASGRLPDNVAVNLRSGNLRLSGNAILSSVETIGNVEGAGYSSITVAAGTQAAARLNAAALARRERGTFLFRAPQLGRAAAPGVGTIFFSQALTGLVGGGGSGFNTSIIPYAIGDFAAAGTGAGLVTYDSGTGVRLLDPVTEYASSLSAGATANVRLTTSTSNAAAVTLNALVLNSANITGSGTMTIGSGTLLKAGAASTINNRLAFDAREANIFVGGTAGTLKIAGVISGTQGLTKSGAQELELTATNTFTGPVTINAGTIRILSQSNLGAGSEPIIINANYSGAGLVTGAGNVALSRPLQINSGVAFLSTQGQLTVDSEVFGAGGVRIGNTDATSLVIFPKVNSYAGPTVVEGRLAFSSDAALGAGGPVVLSGSPSAAANSTALRMDGPWNSDRIIEVRGGPTILDTNAFDAAWNGAVTGSGATFRKLGVGALDITAGGPFSGAVTLANGALRFREAGALRLTSLTASTGTSVLLDNTAKANADRLPDTAPITLNGGTFTLLGNASAPVHESLGALSTSATPATTIAITAPGTAPTILSFASYTGSSSRWLLRGDNLGGGPDGAFTRVLFRTPPALTAGLLSGVVVDGNLPGSIESFATYDATPTAGLAIGVRALRPEEYTTGAVLRNVPLGTVPTEANFRVVGETQMAGRANTINSLTFANSGGLILPAGDSLTVGPSGILVPRGVAGQLRGGGAIFSQGWPMLVQGDGDLTVQSRVGSVLKYGTGTLTFDGARQPGDFATVTLHEGRFRPGPGEGTRGTKVEVQQGTILEADLRGSRVGALEGSGSVLTNGGTLAIGGYYFSNSRFDGTMSGSGGIAVVADMTFSVSQPLTFTGAAEARPDSREPTVNPFPRATLVVGNQASLLSARSIGASGEGTVIVDNYVPRSNRIAGISVSLNGGTLRMTGNSTVPVAENAGGLTIRGLSQLHVQPETSFGGSGAMTALGFTDFTRGDRATLSVQGIDSPAAQLRLGVSASSMLIGAGTTASNTPILPFAVHNGGTPGFVTYDPGTGIRPLTEYSSTLSEGDNVRLFGSATATMPMAVNSLLLLGRIDPGTSPITVASGAVFGGSSIAAPLEFNDREAIFGTGTMLRLLAPVHGTNGVTFSGIGGPSDAPSAVFDLQGANSFTGPLTINDATVRFTRMNNLGPELSPIALFDGTLEYTGAEPLTFQRPLRTDSYRGALVSRGGALTMAAPISGSGAMRFTGDIRLATANAYSGYTHVDNTLTFPSDDVFGESPRIYLSAGNSSGGLRLAGPWTTNRTLEVEEGTFYGGFLDTAGFDAMLNGPLTSTGGAKFTKQGLGTLTLNSARDYQGRMDVAAGTLRVNGALEAGSLVLYVKAGAALTGTGRIDGRGTTVIEAGGTLAPGDPVGVLMTDNLMLLSDSRLSLELPSATRHDQVDVAGTVKLEGVVDLVLTLGFDPADGVDAFTIIANDGTDPIAGSAPHLFRYGAENLGEGAVFATGEQQFRISYVGGSGNDVVLYAVPEPSAVLLISFAAALCIGRRRAP